MSVPTKDDASFPYKDVETAPIVYFDFIAAYGVVSGIIQIELAAHALVALNRLQSGALLGDVIDLAAFTPCGRDLRGQLRLGGKQGRGMHVASRICVRKRPPQSIWCDVYLFAPPS